MTIEQTGVIDIISISADDTIANLIISDHLPWNENVRDHLLLLQEKINEYLEFVESGTLYEARPDLREKRLVLKVIAKYTLPIEAEDFYKALQQRLASSGYAFVFLLSEQLPTKTH